MEKSVFFLRGIGKLRVTKPAEDRHPDYGIHGLREHLRELIVILCKIVIGRLVFFFLFVSTKPDSAEFCQHDWLAAMGSTVQGQKPSSRPPAFEQLLGLDDRSVPLVQVFDV